MKIVIITINIYTISTNKCTTYTVRQKKKER